jgi:hypothetical protein
MSPIDAVDGSSTRHVQCPPTKVDESDPPPTGFNAVAIYVREFSGSQKPTVSKSRISALPAELNGRASQAHDETSIPFPAPAFLHSVSKRAKSLIERERREVSQATYEGSIPFARSNEVGIAWRAA